MKKFLYRGPVDSSVTLKVDGKDQDVMLFRGKTVDLPAGHEYVQTLVALGHLVAVGAPDTLDPQPASPADAAPQPKKGAK